MTRIFISLLIFALSLSIAINLFQRQNQAITCSNIDTHRKAELLYKLWHKHLDWNKNWIPCEYLVDDK